MARICYSALDHLDNAFPAVLAPPFTVIAWSKLINPAAASQLITFGTSGSSSNRYSLGYSATNFYGANENDGTSSIAASTLATKDTTNWRMAGGVWTDHTNRAGYLDGVNKGTIAALKAATAPNVTRISADPLGNNPMVALIAHIAIWNIALSDPDMASLATLMPWQVQPTALLEYWPLRTPGATEPSLGIAPHALTVTGTSFSTDDPFPNPLLMAQNCY